MEARCKKDKDFCRTGMLAPDESLLLVLERDEATLQDLHVSRQQIAHVLETVMDGS